jgi:tricorn protease-like protein
VAAGTVQDNVYVFETQTGKIVSVLSGGGLIQVVKFSPNGQYVAFSNPSNVVKVFEVSTGKESWQIDDAGSVEDLAFTANQSYIALACSMMKTGPSIATPKLSTIRVDEIPLRPLPPAMARILRR